MEVVRNVVRVITLVVFAVIIAAEAMATNPVKQPTQAKESITLPASVVGRLLNDKNAKAITVDVSVFKNAANRQAVMSVLDQHDNQEFLLWLRLAGLSK